MSIYDIQVTQMNEETYPLEVFEGKVMLIVNTASKCGFTNQFAQLQSLYEKYQAEGFEILGFPSNQFKNQDPGTNEEILEFCTLHFGVNFKMFKKTHVVGRNIHPLYQFLIQNNPISNENIAWNFEKFLVNKEGQIINRYASDVTPLEIEDDIVRALNQ